MEGRSMFNRKTTYAADYGRRMYTAVTPDGGALTLEPEEFIKLEWIADGSTLIVEDAHVKYFRTFDVRSSLAQPIDEQQQATLIENAKRKRIDLRIFSCGQTRKVFAAIDPVYAAIDSKDKDDETDARLIREYFTTVERQIMTRPLRQYSRDLDALALKMKTDEIINTARSSWGVDGGATLYPSILEYVDGDIDHAAKTLLDIGVVVEKTRKDATKYLDERPENRFGEWLLDRSGSGVFGQRRDMVVEFIDRSSFTFLYTLMCCVIDPITGKRTSNLNHRQLQSILLTPSDKRIGGVARSNVYWHYLRARHINAAMKELACECGSKPVNYKDDRAELACGSCSKVRSEWLAACRIGTRSLLRLFIEWVSADESERDKIHSSKAAAETGSMQLF